MCNLRASLDFFCTPQKLQEWTKSLNWTSACLLTMALFLLVISHCKHFHTRLTWSWNSTELMAVLKSKTIFFFIFIKSIQTFKKIQHILSLILHATKQRIWWRDGHWEIIMGHCNCTFYNLWILEKYLISNIYIWHQPE